MRNDPSGWASYDPWEREPLMVGEMICRCVYCGREYARKPCIQAMGGSVSHGLCAACVPVARAKMGVDR